MWVVFMWFSAVLAHAIQVRRECTELSRRVQLLRLATESLTVTGAAQFAARVSSEDQQLTRLRDSPDSVRSSGVANNVCGLEAELAVLRWAPEVVALGLAVRSEDGRTSASVDVVAGGGLWWIEVKAVAYVENSRAEAPAHSPSSRPRQCQTKLRAASSANWQVRSGRPATPALLST